MKWWEGTSLNALQKKWYRKLKQSGFNDIEDTNSPREYLKTWESTHFAKIFQLRGAEQYHGQALYYERAGKFLHEYRFKTRTQKQIWKLHSEGIGMNRIATTLEINAAGCENSVHTIIKNLQNIMKSWSFDVE